MQISVNTNSVLLQKKDTIESGEYNVTPCNFTFTEEYDGLIKTAVFTKNGTSYKMNIINNLCQIPYEVLEHTGVVALGVFAYEEQDSNLILRYSPRPTVFNVTQGSYKENAENSTPPTPTQFEQYEQALNEGLTEVANVDIDATKVGTTATITITNRNGTEKAVTISDGEQGIQGPQGLQGPQGIQGIQGVQGPAGKNGEDGYTPIKGIDYYTEEEQIEMQNDITAVLEGEIPDVSNFITKDVNNLTYYTNTTDINTSLSSKQNTTDNTLTTTSKIIPSAINEVNSIAKGANQSLSYNNYSSMVTAFNSLSNNVYNVGQNVMIITLEVPDLWVSSIESTSVPYTYTTDAAITTALETNGYIQVGYYKLSQLETQKVDLTNFVSKSSFTYDDTTETLAITIS